MSHFVANMNTKDEKYFNITLRITQDNFHKTRQDKQNRNKENLSTDNNEANIAEINDKSINNHDNNLRETVQTQSPKLFECDSEQIIFYHHIFYSKSWMC